MNPKFGKNKYKSQRTEYNGQPYASKAEAKRAENLDLLLRAGEIRGWLRQVTVCLGLPENRYRIDFLVFSLDGRAHAEDVKGVETEKFQHNKRLWKRYGPCPLHIIKGKKLEIVDPFEESIQQ